MGNAEAPIKKNYNPSPGDNSAPLGKIIFPTQPLDTMGESGQKRSKHGFSSPPLIERRCLWLIFLFSSLCGNGGARIVRNIEFCLLFFFFSGKKPDDIETDCERGYSWKKSGEGRTLKTNLNHLTSLPPSLPPKSKTKKGEGRRRRSIFWLLFHTPKPPTPTSAELFPLLSPFIFPTARLSCSTARRRRSWNCPFFFSFSPLSLSLAAVPSILEGWNSLSHLGWGFSSVPHKPKKIFIQIIEEPQTKNREKLFAQVFWQSRWFQLQWWLGSFSRSRLWLKAATISFTWSLQSTTTKQWKKKEENALCCCDLVARGKLFSRNDETKTYGIWDFSDRKVWMALAGRGLKRGGAVPLFVQWGWGGGHTDRVWGWGWGWGS